MKMCAHSSNIIVLILHNLSYRNHCRENATQATSVLKESRLRSLWLSLAEFSQRLYEPTVLHISKSFFRFSDLPGLSSFLNVPYHFVNISMVGLFFRWSSLCWSPRLPLQLKPVCLLSAFQMIVDILQRLFKFSPWDKVWIAQYIITFLRKNICTKTHLIARNRWKYLLYPSFRRISLAPNRPNLKPACGGPLDRKADSILPNGLRQHTILYEIRRLLKSFSQIKN